jgi:hypothetical protein
LPRGSVFFQFNRGFGVDAQDVTQAFTGLTAGYEHVINRSASVDLSARYLSRDLGDEASLIATYRHAPDTRLEPEPRLPLRPARTRVRWHRHPSRQQSRPLPQPLEKLRHRVVRVPACLPAPVAGTAARPAPVS